MNGWRWSGCQEWAALVGTIAAIWAFRGITNLLLFSLFEVYLWHPHNIITNIIIWSVIRVLKARYLILCLFKGFYFWDEERERKWKMWWHEGRIMRMRDGMEWMMIYCKSVRDFWRRIIVLLLWFFLRLFIIDDLMWIFINGFWYDDCYD